MRVCALRGAHAPTLSGMAATGRPSFGTTRKGFDRGEVLAYLAGLEVQLQELRSYADDLREANASLQRRVAELTEQLEAAPRLAAGGADETAIAAAVGEEMANVIRTARNVAEDLRAKATKDAEQILTSARTEADDTTRRARSEAEEILAGARADAAQDLESSRGEAARTIEQAKAEADRLVQVAHAEAERTREEAAQLYAARIEEANRKMGEATADAERHAAEIKARATVEVEAVLAQASAEAATIRGEVDRERRVSLEQAQAARERILADLARRRRVATVQIEQLRAGRERLMASYSLVRRTLEEVSEEFRRADAEARAAAEEVGRRLAATEDDGGGLDPEHVAGSAAVPTGDPDPGPGTGPGPAPEGAGPGEATSDPVETPEALAAEATAAEAPAASAEALPGTRPEGAGGPEDGEAPDGGSPSPLRSPWPYGGASPSSPPGWHGVAGAPAPSVQPRSALRVDRPDAPGTTGRPDVVDVTDGGVVGLAGGHLVVDLRSARPGRPGGSGELSLGGGGSSIALLVAGDEGDASAGMGCPPAAGELSGGSAGEQDSAPGASEHPGLDGRTPVSSTPAAGGSTPGDAVTGLFERIRAGRARAVQQARRTLAPQSGIDGDRPGSSESAGAPGGGAPDGTDGDRPGGSESAGAPGSSPETESGEDHGARGDDAARLDRRDDALRAAGRDLTRRLKRELQDEQSELLDRLRSLGGRGDAGDLLPPVDAQRRRYAVLSSSFLGRAGGIGAAGAAGEGEGAAGMARGLAAAAPGAAPDVGGLSDELAEALVVPLRRRVEGLVAELGDAEDREALVEAISTAYREVKTNRIEALALDRLYAAHALGWWRAVPAATPLRWIACDADGACADCDDNTLAGAVGKGDPFPTGQLLPPAHEGCRCLLARVDTARDGGPSGGHDNSAGHPRR